MFPLAAFHHLASGRKDGLLPEFADLLHGREKAIETSSNVARLDNYRETFTSQAGPNPKGTAENLDDDKIVTFHRQSRDTQYERQMMYIAMNRFKVQKGSEEAFENVWKNRESTLDEMKGFKEFHLLRGAFNEAEGYTLFASHTVWASHEDFVAWTKSENFRAAHRNAGDNKPLYIGHPNFEGFSVVEGA